MNQPPNERLNARNPSQSQSQKNTLTKKDQLTFKPITQGLGFHPFSDGMPYAPISRSGTGAVSGGTPQFNFPKSQGTAMPLRTPQSAPHTPFPPHRAPQVARPHAPVFTPSAIPAPAPERITLIPVRYDFSYSLKRVIAFVLDTTLNFSLCAAAFSFVLWKIDVSPTQLFSQEMLLLMGLFLAFFNGSLIVAQEIAFGTTLGKHIFRLELDGNASALFLRSFFFWVSLGFGGLGIIWALFDPNRRCWHDLIANVQPIEN